MMASVLFGVQQTAKGCFVPRASASPAALGVAGEGAE